MKRFLTIALMTCLLTMGATAQVKWNTIENASQTASTNKSKLYFTDFYTSWCGWCKKMDRDTFTDPTVAKILNKYYIPVKFDAEGKSTFVWKGKKYTNSGRTHDFVQAVLGQKMGFPSFAIFKADQTLLTVVPGYNGPDDFVVILWYFASGDYEKYTFEKYAKIFNSEIRPTMVKALEK